MLPNVRLTFVRNHGDLAEGWYDPATLRKAQTSVTASNDSPPTRHRPSPPRRPSSPKTTRFEEEKETRENNASSGEDIIGPTLPNRALLHPTPRAKGKAPGPSLPNTQDLALRRELEFEDLAQSRSDLHQERKSDRQLQKTQLEELVPRAEAGSKERMLEKKREKSDANRAFASAKGDAMEEVGEADLMGGDDGGVEGFKKRKVVEERKKSEREVRKEEILRARREEREERVRVYQEREERTMSGLVALARARFG